jgi:cytosine/adenosine deaminase-related metal-dependent hydrolase
MPLFWRNPLTMVNAQVLGPGGELARTLRIRRGRIDGIGVAPDKSDTVLDLDGAFVFPGLINAHDHLELNSQPRLKWRQCYANAREWVADFQPRFATDPDLAVNHPETLIDRLWVGGLKNLLSGVTTVCHHNPLHRPLRLRFPVKVVQRFGFSHSLYVDGDRVADVHRDTPTDWPWMIHAAEGTDEEARADVAALERLGCLAPNTVLIHGVALCQKESERVLRAGAGLVWCPSSNQFLFGRTADVRPFDGADRLALGSDSRLSGAGDLLDELRVAHETHQLSTESLARLVSTGAARLLRLEHAGRIAAGHPADLIVVRSASADPFDTLVHAARTDVALAMVDGSACVGEPSMAAAFTAAGVATMPARLDGAPRLVARWIGRRVEHMRVRERGFEVVH